MNWLRNLFGFKKDPLKQYKMQVDEADDEEGGDTIIKGA
jgi:hypothetical protein